MTVLRLIYLILTIIGTFVPLYFLFSWYGEDSFSIANMLSAWTANGASKALTSDLLISAAALYVFAITESIARRRYLPLLAIPATFLIGLSCGLPLYLFLRSKPLD